MSTNIVQSISDEALAELEEHYTSEPVPACRVCGAPLSVSSIGGGRPTVWSCSNEAALIVDGKMDWDHYGKSQFEQRRTGDSRVVGLIARLRSAEVDASRRGKALSEILSQVDLNIRPTVRDIINGMPDANDIYGYCDAIDRIAMQAMESAK